jgi:hypothetical protein
MSGQNFVGVAPTSLVVQAVPQGTNLNLGWFGANGVSYQIQSSTDLINWTPYGNPVTGTNGPINITIPPGASPQMFFRFVAY